MGDPATPTPADRKATRGLAAAVVEAVRSDARHPLAPGDHGTLIDCDENELEMAMLGMAMEIEALVADNDAMATKSIQDHVEYKQRRNAQFAAYDLAHFATIAFLLDRAEQYDNSSGYRAFIDELVAGIAQRRHVQCAEAGEYDDMKERVNRIVRSHGKVKP